MIEYLRIQNLALIKNLEMELAPGLNVLTGETGAGKSFIIKALNFLTGDRLAGNLVRPGQEKAIVEAMFVLPETELILRRELLAENGRSRIFLNNILSTQDEIKNLKPSLILHTSQFGQQKLLQPAYQAKLIDSLLNDQTLLHRRENLLNALREKIELRREILERCRILQEKRELLEFQSHEIDKLNPLKDEEISLEERKTAIKNASQNKAKLEHIQNLLHGGDAGQLGIFEALTALDREILFMSKLNPKYEPYLEELNNILAWVSDLSQSLKPDRSQVVDERDLEAIEARLFTLAQLRRKLGRPLNEIVDLRQEIEENLHFLDASQLDVRRIEKEQNELTGQLAGILERLNPARRQAGDDLAKALIIQLAGLGFAKELEVKVEFTPEEIYPGLIEERPRILWRPNPGQATQPLDKIASGGELSRFLLAMAGIMADTENLPTLIFDEVDAGVGGLTLNRVAEHIENLAKRQQIILITHWPKLAALAGRPDAMPKGRHFQILKEVVDQQTYSSCRALQDQTIIDELNRMAGEEGQGKHLA